LEHQLRLADQPLGAALAAHEGKVTSGVEALSGAGVWFVCFAILLLLLVE
jgi:hypothetical protein